MGDRKFALNRMPVVPWPNLLDCAVKLKEKIKDASKIKSITAKVGEGTFIGYGAN